jgi:hypothetical protein
LSLGAVVNPAGGLRYHLRARRYAKKLWHPFRWALGEWLLGWKPPEPTLALFGPSGGYCLQPFVFERFERVVCFEPDPLAYAIFRRRIARAPLERRPLLERIGEDHLVGRSERLLPRLEALGPSALLFSNLLGQIPMLLAEAGAPSSELANVHEHVAAAASTRSFASFHDRFSGEQRLDFEQPIVARGRLTDRELLDLVYHSPDEPSPGSLQLLDHQTSGIFPDSLEHAYFWWELEPGLFHLIEGVRAPSPSFLTSHSPAA